MWKQNVNKMKLISITFTQCEDRHFMEAFGQEVSPVSMPYSKTYETEIELSCENPNEIQFIIDTLKKNSDIMHLDYLITQESDTEEYFCNFERRIKERLVFTYIGFISIKSKTPFIQSVAYLNNIKSLET